MWSEPTKTALGAAERRRPQLLELGIAAHRVLELRAVRLDGERRTGRRRHRPAHHDVVREDEVGRQALAHRRSVRA